MSASVCWEPIDPMRRTFNVCGNERECLFKLFSGETAGVICLGMDDIPRLEGLAVVYEKINHVIEAIAKYGKIRIWTEF